MYSWVGKQQFEWKHSEHQRRENTFSVLRFLKAASLFVFFSEDSMRICSALFDLCLVSCAQQINLHKAFHFFCCHQTIQVFCIDKRALFFFKGKSIQMVFLPPTRWFSSSVSFPTPARMRLIYGRYQTRTTTLRSGSPLTVSSFYLPCLVCVFMQSALRCLLNLI